MLDTVTAARDEALERIAAAATLDDVVALDSELLSKRGVFAGFKTALGSLATVDDKKQVGQALNAATTVVAAALEQRRTELSRAARAHQLETERLDLTEVIGGTTRGHAHLVTQAWQRLEDVFIGLGFQVAEGPEVETDFYNFEALNMPRSHPARSGFDTLFTDYRDDGSVLLRTHTSPVQIRVMQSIAPPIYMVMPGRVFRRDTPDATHMPVFHQIEGLVIDRGITMAHLAGTIDGRVRHPTARRHLDRVGRMRHGAPQRAAGRRPRPRGVERLRVRIRYRPHGARAPRHRRHPRHVQQRHPVHRAVLRRST
jgi:phenylalanyl-tRNA synthetase alpha chain